MQTETNDPKSAAFTIRIDETMLGALDHLAAKTERSRNWLVAKAIEDYIELNTWQIGKIQAGLDAAASGDFASEEEVARVFKKFSKHKSKK